jgi:hypothetical protein
MEDFGRQTSRFRTKQKRITLGIVIQVIALRALGGYRKNAALLQTVGAISPIVMDRERGELVIIQPGPTQPLIVQRKAQRPHQMQDDTGIGTEPDDIAGVRGNLRLKKNDGEHQAVSFQPFSPPRSTQQSLRNIVPVIGKLLHDRLVQPHVHLHRIDHLAG